MRRRRGGADGARRRARLEARHCDRRAVVARRHCEQEWSGRLRPLRGLGVVSRTLCAEGDLEHVRVDHLRELRERVRIKSVRVSALLACTSSEERRYARRDSSQRQQRASVLPWRSPLRARRRGPLRRICSRCTAQRLQKSNGPSRKTARQRRRRSAPRRIGRRGRPPPRPARSQTRATAARSAGSSSAPRRGLRTAQTAASAPPAS